MYCSSVLFFYSITVYAKVHSGAIPFIVQVNVYPSLYIQANTLCCYGNYAMTQIECEQGECIVLC